ncbi:MAG: sarcosine oxidase subunit delta [Pseudomonadota bacterium]
MLMLQCPYCGVIGEETEFTNGGEAHLKRFGPGSTDEEFHGYLFSRENPRGVHFERWHHTYGCGKWFLVARNTLTLEVYGTYKAQNFIPPQAIKDAITAKVPGWRWREFA